MTFSATDNVGIRRAEIVDVTDAANPSVVASEDYNSTATAQNARCDFTKPRPCPDLKNETLAPSPAIAGKRTLLLRVTDAAGNQTVSRRSRSPRAGRSTARAAATGRASSPASPATPSAAAARRASRSASCARPRPSAGVTAPRCAGSCATPPASRSAGAELRLLVRELRLGSHYVDRGAVTTGADGRFTFRHPARLLAALPRRLPRLSGRRRAHREVRRHLQHQGAHHRPRRRAMSARAGARASAAASPAARCRRAA